MLSPQGMIFRCQSKRGMDYRYVVKRVQCYSTTAERDSSKSYSGPLFESLEPELQEALDELLSTWLINTDVVDFIEASSQYYNNAEHMRWLLNINDFISN